MGEKGLRSTLKSESGPGEGGAPGSCGPQGDVVVDIRPARVVGVWVEVVEDILSTWRGPCFTVLVPVPFLGPTGRPYPLLRSEPENLWVGGERDTVPSTICGLFPRPLVYHQGHLSGCTTHWNWDKKMMGLGVAMSTFNSPYLVPTIKSTSTNILRLGHPKRTVGVTGVSRCTETKRTTRKSSLSKRIS